MKRGLILNHIFVLLISNFINFPWEKNISGKRSHFTPYFCCLHVFSETFLHNVQIFFIKLLCFLSQFCFFFEYCFCASSHISLTFRLAARAKSNIDRLLRKLENPFFMERTGISICEWEIDVFQNSSSLMQRKNSAIAFQRSHYFLSFSGAPLNLLSTLTKCSTFYNQTTSCIWRDVLVTNLFQPYISVSLL